MKPCLKIVSKLLLNFNNIRKNGEKNMIGQGQVPIIILKEGTERTKGRDAQKNNIMAATIVAETIKSTLGPKGMDKMLVDSLGDILISNDGATVLDEIDVQHPAAKMIVQVAKAQDDETGDGTTSSVVLAGEFLKHGLELLDKKIHASLIVEGYKAAASKAQKYLEEFSKTLEPFAEENTLLHQIATTSLHSKAVHGAKEKMASIAVKSVEKVADKENDEYTVDLDNIKILQKTGKNLAQSEFIEGVIVDKEVVHPAMPKSVKDAKILLLNYNVEVQKGEWDREIRISDPLEMKSFLDNEEQILREMVDQIIALGATVVVVGATVVVVVGSTVVVVVPVVVVRGVSVIVIVKLTSSLQTVFGESLAPSVNIETVTVATPVASVSD